MGVAWVILGVLVAVVMIALAILAIRIARQIRHDDPGVWRREIRKFEIDDARAPVEAGRIVFVGGSTIRLWSSLAQDMKPLAVLNRGFGGARIRDLIHYAQEVAIRHRPRAVVFYAGENDIAGFLTAQRKSPQDVRKCFEKFCSTVFASLSTVHIYFVSIKPPKRRIAAWPEMQEANRLIRESCDNDDRLHFIDLTSAMLNEHQRVRENLFVRDGIHLNRHGYEVLTSVIKPHLVIFGAGGGGAALPVGTADSAIPAKIL